MRNTHRFFLPAILIAFLAVNPITAPGQITGLFGFSCGNVCPNGWSPAGGLLQASDGNFYGTTSQGGNGVQDQVWGTIFGITATGQFRLLYTFSADSGGKFSNGAQPLAGLVEGNDGALYGTTVVGGANNAGVVFRVTKSGTLTVLHHFCSMPGCADGSSPFTPLALGSDGKLYGTASAGGSDGAGTFFRISSAGAFKLLHTLNGTSDGGQPLSGFVEASDGNFYTGTNTGTDNLAANIVSMTPSGALSVLGPLPLLGNVQGELIQASDGLLHGNVQYGDLLDSTLSGDMQVLSLLTPQQVGNGPLASGEIQASDGNLWGTGEGQSLGPFGAIYTATLGGTFIRNFTFNCANGGLPKSVPVQGSDGKFYGTTAGCGTDASKHRAFGEIYSLDAGLLPPLAAIRNFAPKMGSAGKKVMIRGEHFIGTTAVTFNGVAAQFQVLNTKFIAATVPAGATKGLIFVTNPGGTVKSAQLFKVSQ